MIHSGYVPTPEEMDRLSEITPSDIEDAKQIGRQDVPRLKPAFNAELIDPQDDPGPLPDSE